MDTYLTLARTSEGLYKEKGSKFLAFAIPVSDVEEVKEILKEKRKEYHDARHVCFAYVMGEKGEETRANDDGEPSGTAGKPMLGTLVSKGVTNVLLVVVRYFGGTKLGTSGLINAYREACLDALEQNEVVEKIVESRCDIQFEYPFLNDVMRVVKEENATIVSQNFDNDCSMRISIRKRDEEKLRSRLSKIERLIFLDEKA
ncbi:MAG: YigZ family protein [Paludibacteraceae bacterium]|nr:YigZ family protein [Paludibacteraceae bacterium]